jgi:hypothetical protein
VAAGLREFVNSTAGKAISIILALAGIAAIYYSIKSNLGASDVATISRDRIFICSETHKTFEHVVSIGESYPVMSPYSGKATGYRAEACYWTKDGQIKEQPTWVLLNQDIGRAGPTFCPDCGRLVIGHNPMPKLGDKPPPNAAEYGTRRAAQQ